MGKQGTLNPTEWLAIIVMIAGTTGFVLWGLGIGLQITFLQGAGASIVAFMGFAITFVQWVGLK